MFAIIFAGVSGFVAGLLHVFCGPDHLAAIAPLSADHRWRAWMIGFRWGLGHASGVILVGMLSLVFKGFLPLELLSSWAEKMVGVVLIGLGLWGLRRALTRHVHAHEHAHEGMMHIHFHVHDEASARKHHLEKSHAHTHTAFAIGTLHGLAGSAHFLGVLPALAFPTMAESGSYLAAYGVGTILAMTAFSGAVGWLAGGFARGGARLYRACMLGCSAAAVVVGVVWLAI